MNDFRTYLSEQLNDKTFATEWKQSEYEYSLARSLILARKNYYMPQKQLAKKPQSSPPAKPVVCFSPYKGSFPVLESKDSSKGSPATTATAC